MAAKKRTTSKRSAPNAKKADGTLKKGYKYVRGGRIVKAKAK